MHNTLHDQLVYWDHVAWFYLNVKWHNAVLDTVMPFVRNQWFWTPLYLFLAIFMPSHYRKQGWILCAMFLITFAISDQVSASLIKPFFNRVRPCNNETLHGIVHLLVPCGNGKSFPSSHASNHFALAWFMSLTLGRMARWVWPAALLWAVLVCYAQVYVGVHYPLDVFAGGTLGTCVGIGVGMFCNKFTPLPSRRTGASSEEIA